jgi:hypothetical protein
VEERRFSAAFRTAQDWALAPVQTLFLYTKIVIKRAIANPISAEAANDKGSC